jgi:hypothetical protein
LQLTHQKEETVVPISDESLRFPSAGARCLQGRLERRSDIRRENPYLRAWGNLVGAAFRPVEHRHRIPVLVVQHAVDDRSRHVGLLPLELPDAVRYTAPELTDADDSPRRAR